MSTNSGKSDSYANRNRSDSEDTPDPIRPNESDLFAARLKEVIGDESVRSFADRCGISDRLIGSYLRKEKLPGLLNLRSIADLGGVTIDWLATGRPPKTRAEARWNGDARTVARLTCQAGESPRYESQPSERKGISERPGAPDRINSEALGAILGGIVEAMGPAPDCRRAARKAVSLYLESVADGTIVEPGEGSSSATE